MKALLQRVSCASVEVEGKEVGVIKSGLLIFLGVDKSDTDVSCQKMLDKVLSYRMFSDANGKMNLNVQQVSGELLVVSQFTLIADTQKGLRPSFSRAGRPDESKRLYELFIDMAQSSGVLTKMGQFGADMKVSLINDGPVTFLLES